MDAAMDAGDDGGGAMFDGGADGTTFSDTSRPRQGEPRVLVLTPRQAEVGTGHTVEMQATILDGLGNTLEPADRDLQWSSSDSETVELATQRQVGDDDDGPGPGADAGMDGPGGPDAGMDEPVPDAGEEEGEEPGTVPNVRFARGLQTGQATVRVTLGDLEAEATVNVRRAQVRRVQVAPSSAVLAAGETRRFSAAAFDRFGNALNERSVSWRSQDESIVTIDSSGLVQGVAPGSTQIVANIEGERGRATVRVEQQTVTGVEITPASTPQLSQGSAVQLTAIPLSNGNRICPESEASQNRAMPCGYQVTWLSGSGSIATVTDEGTVVAQNPGTAKIFAIIEGQQDNVSVTVQAPNQNTPPTADAGNGQTVTVGSSVTLDGSSSSDSGQGFVSSYQWSFKSTPQGASPSFGRPSQTKPSFTPQVTGTYVIELVVTDNTGKKDTDTVQVIVHEAPIAEAGANQTVAIGSMVQLDGSLSDDPDGQISQYQWSFLSSPSGSPPSFQPNNQGPTPTFNAVRTGTYEVELRVIDDQNASDTDTATITVQQSVSNSPPNASVSVSPQGPQVGTQVQLDGSISSDPDGSIQLYKWTLQTQPSNASARLSARDVAKPTFTPDQPGNYEIQLKVWGDKGQTDTTQLNLSVQPQSSGNQQPRADAGMGRSIDFQQGQTRTVSLDGSGSNDPDGTIQSYNWTFQNTPSGANPSFSDATVAQPTFDASTAGTYRIELEVTDNQGATGTDRVEVTLNLRPMADAGSDKTTQVGNQVQLDGTGSSDTDGSIQSFLWSIENKPSGSNATLNNTTVQQPTFTPQTTGTYEIKLTVTDDQGATDSDRVTITVQ
jgi:hypothetical protein